MSGNEFLNCHENKWINKGNVFIDYEELIIENMLKDEKGR